MQAPRVVVPIITPFDAHGQVYERGVRNLLEFLSGRGIRGVWILGSYGAFPLMETEERERMNDDRSLRVLHDAERYLGGTLARQTTDDERCRWIEVLYKACRDIEEKQAEALPALRGFDADEAYRVITRLFQSVLKDRVTADLFRRAEKQCRAASSKITSQAEKVTERARKNQEEKGGQGVLNLG